MSNLLREYIKQSLFIQQLNEAKSKDGLNTPEAAALLSNKVLGFAAEWAVYAALGGAENKLTDKRIVGKKGTDGPWPQAGRKKGKSPSQEKFDEIYGQMIAAVKLAVKQKKLNLGTPEGAPGSGTQKVDVMSTLADIHVKYNDFKRLLGFQKEKEESSRRADGRPGPVDDESDRARARRGRADIRLPTKPGQKAPITPVTFPNTAAVYDASLTQFFEEIRTEGNEIYEDLSDENKVALSTPKLIAAHHSGARLSGRKKAKSFPKGEASPEYIGFLQYKAAYQEAVKIVGRARFYKILNTGGFKSALLRDIEQLLFKSANKIKNARGEDSETSKKIYFAKFSGPNIGSLDSAVTCEFYDYSKILNLGKDGLIGKMNVIEYLGPLPKQNADAIADAVSGEEDAVPATTTTFYQVVDKDNKDIVYFDIEFRLDGDSHPPQLKAASGITELGSGDTKKVKRR